VNLKKDYSKKKKLIFNRLNDFKKLKNKDNFYELCFCLLTPQSKAKKADNAIKQLIKLDFKNKNVDPTHILKNNIRFHNNKSSYLLELKDKYSMIKEYNTISINLEKRDFLVKNVKGLGLKEASHFLRNTGHTNLAILDRHILKNLLKLNVIYKLPKSLTPKLYLDIEARFLKYSNKIKIPMDHLDLLFWSTETGEIFK